MALFDMLPSLNGWNKEVKFVTAFYLLVEHPKLQDFLKINDNDKCWVPNKLVDSAMWWTYQSYCFQQAATLLQLNLQKKCTC